MQRQKFSYLLCSGAFSSQVGENKLKITSGELGEAAGHQPRQLDAVLKGRPHPTVILYLIQPTYLAKIMQQH
ncbi:hypothetical protein NIES4073_34230 [Kalymmatonema gypsitolerans NIES-4073]|nr:hypothetical protein NIES4073_34230 [Scytonema sp. NIES-4073]